MIAVPAAQSGTPDLMIATVRRESAWLLIISRLPPESDAA
jgi:hypothetical protein